MQAELSDILISVIKKKKQPSINMQNMTSLSPE